MTQEEKRAQLKAREKELERLKEKIGKGEVAGNGAPQLIQDLTSEINKLKIELGITEL